MTGGEDANTLHLNDAVLPSGTTQLCGFRTNRGIASRRSAAIHTRRAVSLAVNYTGTQKSPDHTSHCQPEQYQIPTSLMCGWNSDGDVIVNKFTSESESKEFLKVVNTWQRSGQLNKSRMAPLRLAIRDGSMVSGALGKISRLCP